MMLAEAGSPKQQAPAPASAQQAYLTTDCVDMSSGFCIHLSLHSHSSSCLLSYDGKSIRSTSSSYCAHLSAGCADMSSSFFSRSACIRTAVAVQYAMMIPGTGMLKKASRSTSSSYCAHLSAGCADMSSSFFSRFSLHSHSSSCLVSYVDLEVRKSKECGVQATLCRTYPLQFSSPKSQRVPQQGYTTENVS